MERFRESLSEQTVSVSSAGIDIHDRTPNSVDETLLWAASRIYFEKRVDYCREFDMSCRSTWQPWKWSFGMMYWTEWIAINLLLAKVPGRFLHEMIDLFAGVMRRRDKRVSLRIFAITRTNLDPARRAPTNGKELLPGEIISARLTLRKPATLNTKWDFNGNDSTTLLPHNILPSKTHALTRYCERA